MIMTVTELRQYVTTTETDDVLEAKLKAIELLIRKYTNNNFQDRRYRRLGTVKNGAVYVYSSAIFSVGDTIMVNEDLVVILSITDNVMTVSEPLLDAESALVTKIVYPMDIKIGVANMVKWDINTRDKVGIQSETISRHSVTYFNMDGDNSALGYPKSLTGFLKPYMKARF